MKELVTEEKIKTIENSLFELINEKGRVDRFFLMQSIRTLTNSKRKSINIENLTKLELKVSERLSNHIKVCPENQPCLKEKAINTILNSIDTKKRELIDRKTFWENIITNPVGIGILLIGVGNIFIAILNLINN